MSKQQVITAGFSGYTAPYQDALGAKYDYVSLRNEHEVAGVDWTNVFAVIFTGGADISPTFYNQERAERTHLNDHHDRLDGAVLDAIMNPDFIHIIKYGTCRGAQLLWARYGGVLYQHIPGHGRSHMATLTYDSRGNLSGHDSPLFVEASKKAAADFKAGKRKVNYLYDYEMSQLRANATEMQQPATFEITSLHHQACNWESWTRGPLCGINKRAPLLLMAGESEEQTAVEAWVSTSHKMLGFQYHPEWMDTNTAGYMWTKGAIQRMANMNPTVDYVYPFGYSNAEPRMP